MNYEEFYHDVQILEKEIKEKLLNAQKSFKNSSKHSENGNLKNLIKDVAQMKGFLSECRDLTNRLQELTESFDAKVYIESGDFARQMSAYLEQYAVDVTGKFPNYNIFPYTVKIDVENQDLYVNGKKVQCVRPLSFVKHIKQIREKHFKAPFNVNIFLKELAAAYDLAVEVKASQNQHRRTEYDLLLMDLYTYMAPTQRARRDYTLQNYAFDLARLYASDVEDTKDGRKFDLGTSKTGKKLIRILDQNGNEQFLGTIRFYKVD